MGCWAQAYTRDFHKLGESGTKETRFVKQKHHEVREEASRHLSSAGIIVPRARYLDASQTIYFLGHT